MPSEMVEAWSRCTPALVIQGNANGRGSWPCSVWPWPDASVVAGEGLTKNAVEAERLIGLRLRAADHGNTDAPYGLGVMYATGKGGVDNVAEAARLFRLAADQGRAEAQFSLGVMYEIGKRVEDSESAKETQQREPTSPGCTEWARAFRKI